MYKKVLKKFDFSLKVLNLQIDRSITCITVGTWVSKFGTCKVILKYNFFTITLQVPKLDTHVPTVMQVLHQDTIYSNMFDL